MVELSVALVKALGAIIGAVISGAVSLVVASKQHSKSMALIEYRLKELELKQDKHNQLIERMYKVEAKVDAMQDK